VLESNIVHMKNLYFFEHYFKIYKNLNSNKG
jgi:hypothetical protein